jgi:hypothetical protein
MIVRRIRNHGTWVWQARDALSDDHFSIAPKNQHRGEPTSAVVDSHAYRE